MKTKIKVIFIILLIINFSCLQSVQKMYNSDLQEALDHFKPSFLEHFDNVKFEDIRTYRYSYSENEGNLYTGAYFIARINIYDCDSIYKYLSLKSVSYIEQSALSNSEFLLYPQDNSNYITDLQIYCDSARNVILPNLNYELNDSMLINTNSSNSYTFFTIELNNKCMLNNNLKWDDNLMPQKWKHGFSKGIALNCTRNKAFAWIIIW